MRGRATFAAEMPLAWLANKRQRYDAIDNARRDISLCINRQPLTPQHMVLVSLSPRCSPPAISRQNFISPESASAMLALRASSFRRFSLLGGGTLRRDFRDGDFLADSIFFAISYRCRPRLKQTIGVDGKARWRGVSFSLMRRAGRFPRRYHFDAATRSSVTDARRCRQR